MILNFSRSKKPEGQVGNKSYGGDSFKTVKIQNYAAGEQVNFESAINANQV